MALGIDGSKFCSYNEGVCRNHAPNSIAESNMNEVRNERGGVCPICNRNLPEDSAEQCVDHDHLTGYCRALVHRSCNVWIGRVENDPELPKRTMDYLERFKTN